MNCVIAPCKKRLALSADDAARWRRCRREQSLRFEDVDADLRQRIVSLGNRDERERGGRSDHGIGHGLSVRERRALLVRSARPATTVITTAGEWFCCRPAGSVVRPLQCVEGVHIAIASS